MLCFGAWRGRGGDGAEQSDQIMSGVCGHWVRRVPGVSQIMARFRGWIQAGATLLTNLHLPNFLKGGLYQGAGKTVCVPGLNCYSCPAAAGACPIGAYQAVVGSSKFQLFLLYHRFSPAGGGSVGAFPLRLSVSLRLVSGAAAQDPDEKALHKEAQTTDVSEIRSSVGDGMPDAGASCERCGDGRPLLLQVPLPSGRVGGGDPIVSRPIPVFERHWVRSLLGNAASCLAVVVLSVVFYRPFCKWLCPAGCDSMPC